MMTENNNTKCGYIALIGAPNAGKSTLLNQMVGSKIAIVTPKVQTTRNRILGMCIHESAQCIFVDTPGIFNAKKRFEKAMVRSALDGARDADIVLLMVDSYKGFCDDTKRIADDLKQMSGVTKVLVLNKVDKVQKEKLPLLSKEIFDYMEDEKGKSFDQSFMISAEKGNGVGDVKNYLSQHLPSSPWLYPEDQMTDVPMRMLAAEVTREKLFMRLREELPYSIAVETENWEEKKDGSIKVSQVIFVRTNSQKMIVLGKAGQMLKDIGKSSRHELSKMMDCQVHLFLFVKIAENWKDNKEFYDTIGLEYH